MSKPYIELPTSITADGWADDLFKAAGTRPAAGPSAPSPVPLLAPRPLGGVAARQSARDDVEDLFELLGEGGA